MWSVMSKEETQTLFFGSYSSNSNRYEVPGDLMGLKGQGGCL